MARPRETIKKEGDELHDLLVANDRAQLREYSSYFLKPDHDRTLVLTAHVVAEHLLEGMISTALVHPDAWLRDADFRSKANLARALDLIQAREVAYCKVLNSARNSIAHSLKPLPEKWRVEMERLAYGKGSGLRWKKGISKELNKTLRVLLAMIASRWLQAKFRVNLRKLREENKERWGALMTEKLMANLDSLGTPEEERLAYQVDLQLAKEMVRKNDTPAV